MKKMTGYEYKQFISADWDKMLGVTGAYMDAQEITVNGVDEFSMDERSIQDTDKVVINGGCVLANEDIDLSLETLFTRWKKAQTTTTLVVEIPNDSVEYLTQQVGICRGKVLK
jgi:hypothetical protein